MKRFAVLFLSALIAVAAVSAQGAPAPFAADSAAVSVKVEGKLALVNGMIAIVAKGTTYYVGGLQHLVGFVDGLKEGAAVKVEGYAQQLPMAPEYSHLRITKLTFNGKDYDLSQAMGRGGMHGQGGMMGGQGGQGGMMGGRGGRK